MTTLRLTLLLFVLALLAACGDPGRVAHSCADCEGFDVDVGTST